MMDRFSIVITVYEEYELLRQAFESIVHHVDPGSYKEIIIVDDHSNPRGKLREYLNYIGTLEKTKVITFDEYRVGFHCNDSDLSKMDIDKYSTKEKSFGHGYSLQCGINEVSTDYVLCLDADSVMLPASRDMLYRMGDLFEKYNDVMSIGQLAGLMSHDLITVSHEFVYYFGGRRSGSGGTPGSPAFACRMSGWRDKGIDPIAEKPKIMAWVAGRYARSVTAKGYKLLNFPVFSKKMVFHVGGAIFKFTRPGRYPKSFGFCKDFTAAYAARRTINKLYDWYGGRYVLDMPTDKYVRYMQTKYDSPFGKLQEPLNEKLLYTIDESEGPVIVKHGTPLADRYVAHTWLEDRDYNGDQYIDFSLDHIKKVGK